MGIGGHLRVSKHEVPYVRICPGRHYAEVVYIAAMTTILATVNVVKAHDANGNEIYVQPGAPGKGKLIKYVFLLLISLVLNHVETKP